MSRRRIKLLLLMGLAVALAWLCAAIANFWFLFWALQLAALGQAPAP